MELTKELIRNKIQTNDEWATRAIVALYERQTESEKATQTTKENNHKGFSGLDATFLSSLAEQVVRGRTLSPKQLAAARKLLGKYAGQLLIIAEEKQTKEN